MFDKPDRLVSHDCSSWSLLDCCSAADRGGTLPAEAKCHCMIGGLPAAYEVSALLTDHYGRCVRVAGDERRHH